MTNKVRSRLSEPDVVHNGSITTVPVFGFDLGNRFSKFAIAGSSPAVIQSYRAVIPSFQEIDHSRISPGSHVVEIGAVRYVVGADARGYGARPTFQGADGDKWSHARVFLLAALAELGVSGDVHIELLRTVCPDTQQVDQLTAMQGLQGATSATVDGKSINLVISQVAVYDEGQPAWVMATRHKLWRFPKALNGVLDLGGGTAIARLIAPNGAVVRQSELILPGTYNLAEKIQSHLGGPRSIPEIMDAIADNTFVTPAGRDFRAIFEYCLSDWLADIRGEIRTRWAAFDGQYAQIVIIGGSAPLAKGLVEQNSRYLSIDAPQTVSLRGLIDG